jgi:hypothetical protein
LYSLVTLRPKIMVIFLGCPIGCPATIRTPDRRQLEFPLNDN